MKESFVISLILLSIGIWCLIAVFQGRESLMQLGASDPFLLKKILGKYHGPVTNLIIGIFLITLAFYSIFDLF